MIRQWSWLDEMSMLLREKREVECVLRVFLEGLDCELRKAQRDYCLSEKEQGSRKMIARKGR